MWPKIYIENIWYSNHPIGWLLAPFGWFYCVFVVLRRLCYQLGLATVTRLSVPVIVVGNITVGGTGKTPLVIWLADYLKCKGFKPGIVSRGYGGIISKKIQQVRVDSNPVFVGDEPVLIAKKTRCPVAVSVQRHLAAAELIEHHQCNIILCDDGLQHYSLSRDIEIVVIDGSRRFGNGRCLPAGPLREPLNRLRSVDLMVSKYKAGRHEYEMRYHYGDPISLLDPFETMPLSTLAGKSVHAVAGIANPDHYFAYLKRHKLNVIKHIFPDHHPFTAKDFAFDDDCLIMMTEKDAVKCAEFAKQNYWFLPIKAELPETFEYRFESVMQEIIYG